MNDINDLEERLRVLLRHVDAPATLADAVMARVAREPRRMKALPERQWIGRLAALLALTAVLGGAGAIGVHHRRAVERARAERDFARSQELISRALEPVRQRLRRAGVAMDR